MAYGDYQSARSFDEDIGGSFGLVGVASGGFLYALAHNRQVVVYQLTATGATRATAREFTLPNNIAFGVNQDYRSGGAEIRGSTLYLLGYDTTSGSTGWKVFVYDLSSTGATANTSLGWTLDAAQQTPTGIAINEDGFAYITDINRKIFCYQLTDSGAIRSVSRDFLYANPRSFEIRVVITRGLGYSRVVTFVEYPNGIAFDSNNFAYVVSGYAHASINAVATVLTGTSISSAINFAVIGEEYSSSDDRGVIDTATPRSRLQVYELVNTTAIRRTQRDFSLLSGGSTTIARANGIAIQNGFVYVSALNGINVYEHYPAPPQFPSDVGRSEVFVVGEEITPIVIPDAGGRPAPRYSIAGLPAGLQFNALTRTITGTPLSTGQGTITVTADNTPQS